MASGSVYACGTCRVRFGDLELMQAHYKCDWHRYNLKRKVVELPPIGADSFAEIVKSYQKEADKNPKPLDAGDQSGQQDKLYCKACSKSFMNAGSHAVHIESKKHLEKIANLATSTERQDTKTPTSTITKVPTAPIPSTETQSNEEGMVEDDWEDDDGKLSTN